MTEDILKNSKHFFCFILVSIDTELIKSLKKQQITRTTYNRVIGKIYNAFEKNKDEKI